MALWVSVKRVAFLILLLGIYYCQSMNNDVDIEMAPYNQGEEMREFHEPQYENYPAIDKDPSHETPPPPQKPWNETVVDVNDPYAPSRHSPYDRFHVKSPYKRPK